MPVNDPRKRLKLIDAGYDPDQMDELLPYPTEAQNPTVQQEPEHIEPTAKTSPWGVMGRTALRNAGPGYVGLTAASSMAGALAPTAAIPLVGPAIPIVGGIGAGILASMTAKKAQDALIREALPEAMGKAYAQQEITDAQERPYSTIAGGMLGQWPLMGPGIKSFPGAARAIKDIITKPITQEPIHAADLGNLLNVGLSGAVPTAMRAISDPNASLGELGAEFVGNSFMHNPTKLGQKYAGLHPNTYREFPLEGIKAKQQNGTPIRPDALDPSTVQYNAEYENQPAIIEQKQKEAELKAQEDAKIKEKDLKRQEYEVTKQVNNEKAVDLQDRQTELLRQQETLLKQQEAELTRRRSEDFTKGKTEELGQRLPLFKPADNIPKPVITTELGKEIHPDYTGNQEADITENQTKPLTEAERIQEEYDSGRREQSVSEMAQKMKDEDIPSKPTQETLEAFKKLGTTRGVNVKTQEKVVSPYSGQEILGRALPRSNVDEPSTALISTDKAAIDTIPHELAHNYRHDLATHGNDTDKALVAKGDALLLKSPEYKAWVKEQLANNPDADITPEEFYSSHTGEDVIRRILKTDSKGDFRNWLSDFTSHIKRRFKNASPEDYTRIFGRRLINDPPFDEHFKGNVNVRTDTKEDVKRGEQEVSRLERKEEPLFYNTSAKLLKNGAGFNPDKTIDAKQIGGRLKNLVSPSEYEALKASGLEDFLQGKKTTKEVADWIDENGPKVEVRKLEASGLDKGDTAAGIQHEFETRFGSRYRIVNEFGAVDEAGKVIPAEEVTQPEARELLLRYRKAYAEGSIIKRDNESATARYTMVNPKPLDKMQGAVDILVRIPLKDRPDIVGPYGDIAAGERNANLKYSSSHYRTEGKNLLAHSRGYMETTADGKKVFRVFEVQSDWAQERRSALEKAGRLDNNEWSREQYKKSVADDPLLKHYERLAIKAAIDHARKNGADAIAIDDWKTAALTEGHDKAIRIAQDANGKLPSEEFEQIIEDMQKGELIGGGKFHFDENGNVVIDKNPFEGGDTLHYDKTLPKIAEELTGEKGQVVDFGEHQNTVNKTKINNAAEEFGNTPQELRQMEVLMGNNPYDKYRNDLILKNPDGTPKTSSTALLYPLGKSANKEQFSLFGRTEQTESRLQSEHSKLVDDESRKLSSGISPNKIPVVRDEHSLNLGPLKPEIEKVAAIGTEQSKILADGMREFYRAQREYRGKLVNEFVRPVQELAKLHLTDIRSKKDVAKYWEQSSKELDNVRDWFYGKADKTKDVVLSPNETAIKDKIQSVLKEARTIQNTKSGLRVGGFDENYFPQIPDRVVLDTLHNKPESPEAKALQKNFVDWQIRKGTAKNAEEALELLSKFQEAWNNKIDIASQYGPIDKAEGIGIPPAWREKNLMNAMNRYLERVSRRFAYHDAFQANPKVAEALKTYQSNDTVKGILSDIGGISNVEDRTANAVAGVVKSNMMGTLTGGKDFLGNPFIGWQHMQNPIQAARSLAYAWGNMKENILGSFKTGVNRSQLNTLEWGNEFDHVGVLRRIRDVVSEGQGRNFLEQMTRATAFGQGRLLAMDFAAQLKKGKLTQTGKDFFKNFAEGMDTSKIDNSQLNEMAARFVESVQGTYDMRGLPQFTVKGQLSPILSLARWNIEKMNNYNKYVVTPLLNGNPRPFLMSTLGGIIGGAAVTALVEQLTGRKEKTPKINLLHPTKSEIVQGKDLTLPILYKAVGLASASGLGGLMGDLAKSTMDMTYAKSRPMGYNNVLIEAVENTGVTAANLVRALSQNKYNPMLIVDAAGQILEDNMQAYRIALAQLSSEKKEDIAKSNKLRDLRMFHMLEGDKISDMTTQFNRPLKHEINQQFKKADTPEELKASLPKALRKAFDDAAGDPDKLKNNLKGLKENSYQTLPNPDRMPPSFMRYLQFLEKTQGKEEAVNRLKDYMEKNQVNKMKSMLVPSF